MPREEQEKVWKEELEDTRKPVFPSAVNTNPPRKPLYLLDKNNNDQMILEALFFNLSMNDGIKWQCTGTVTTLAELKWGESIQMR